MGLTGFDRTVDAHVCMPELIEGSVKIDHQLDADNVIYVDFAAARAAREVRMAA